MLSSLNLKRCFPLLALLLAFCGRALAQSSATEVWTEDFESRRVLRDWEVPKSAYYKRIDGFGPATGAENKTAVRVQSEDVRTVFLRKKIPLKGARGRLVLQLDVRTDGAILAATGSSGGVRVGLGIERPGGTDYATVPLPSAPATYTQTGLVVYLPEDATGLTLTLGLENAAGSVSFDNIRITQQVVPRTGATAVIPRKSFSRPLRGVTVAPTLGPDALRRLAASGGQHLYIPLTLTESGDREISYVSYREGIWAQLAAAKALLPLADTLGMQVVLGLHSLPGGRSALERHHRIFDRPELQDSLRSLWRDIALQLRTEPAVAGYNLAAAIYERPKEIGNNPVTTMTLMEKVLSGIREADEVRPVLIENPAYGTAFPASLPADSAIVYAVAMPDVLAFTEGPLRYPGRNGSRTLDAAALRRQFQLLRDRQQKAGVPVYIRGLHAPGGLPAADAQRFLEDCKSIFDSWGWSYSVSGTGM